MQEMSQAGGAGFSMSFSKPDVDTAFLSDFSLMAIIAINFFAGLIISEIKNANIKEGAKYIPVLITISVTLFFHHEKYYRWSCRRLHITGLLIQQS